MTINSIDIKKALEDVERMLAQEKNISPALAAAIKMLMVVMQLLMARLGLNSRNSSKPPAQDPNREKKPREGTGKNRGGQAGHVGSTLCPVDDPDERQILSVDRRHLPKGKYQSVGFEKRQVIDIRIERYVTEYLAEILQDANGKRFVAEFPPGVTRPIQYGASIKAHSVYLSMFQLVPYDRIEMQIEDVYGFPISTGSLVNFNQEAFKRLALFEALAKQQLIRNGVVHADETGINVDGKRIWLHNASSALWTLFMPNEKRGSEAMEKMGILPAFRGTLVHDHWKPYFLYSCTHALCNAHHLRELTYAHEMEGQAWALGMKTLLLAINEAVDHAGGCLDAKASALWRRRYRRLLSRPCKIQAAKRFIPISRHGSTTA